jgi:ATP-dependent Zn protease
MVQMTVTKQQMRERTAYHEAGHVICSIQLGIGVQRATIRPDRPHFARERFVKYRDHRTSVEHLCLICLSGPEAEKLFCGPITDHGDHVDIAMAKNFISDGWPEVMRGYQLSRLRDAAASLVATLWAREGILQLADALLREQTIDALRIYDLVASRERPMHMIADSWV